MVYVVNHHFIRRTVQGFQLRKSFLPSGKILRIRRAGPELFLYDIAPVIHLLEDGIVGEFVRQEDRVEINLDHSPLVGYRLDEFVRQVPAVAGQSLAAGMSRYNGSLGVIEAVTHGVIGAMRNVYDHSKAVHFRNHLLAEGAEASPAVVACAGIADVIVPVVGEGQVAYALLVIIPELVQRAADWRTVLHTYKYGNQSFILIHINIFCRIGKGHFVCVLPYLPAHHGHHLVCQLGSLLVGQGVRSEQREERCVNSSFDHLGKVHLGAGVVNAEVAQPVHLRR